MGSIKLRNRRRTHGMETEAMETENKLCDTKRMAGKRKTTARFDLSSFCKEVRKEEGISQAQIAKKLEVSEETYANWENGRYQPSAEALIQLMQIRAVRRSINLKAMFPFLD